MTAPGTRALDPGIALSVACGLVLIRPQDADRARLAEAVAAVPDTPSAARGLAQVAAAWLAGDMDNHALSVALAVFNAPFCASASRRRVTDPAHAGLVDEDMPLFAPSASTHAARSADAMED
ncbi:hypothetical protein MCW82_07175 [Azospirillum doebereinerae]|uniref:hypothetical protein n=1 Tax=Azospirillum doebereinerae TaxID=92933 RepID=UPI001EE53C20|nr:hypothetical protein [Azospirillum doebereinerae]MCG5239549.1 hypothetical protein [Azospirillum doebereinerae]